MRTLEECLEKPYLLLTPGPLTTSNEVKMAMLKDWCTWDKEYNNIVQEIREKLVKLAVPSGNYNKYTSVLMQGSGSFGVESVIGTAISKNGKLLILSNGAYGNRMGEIAKVLKINYTIEKFGDKEAIDINKVKEILENDSSIPHKKAAKNSLMLPEKRKVKNPAPIQFPAAFMRNGYGFSFSILRSSSLSSSQL